MVQIYYKSSPSDTWHALECYSANVSLSVGAQPPNITASMPLKYANTAFYALKAGDYEAEVSRVQKDVSHETITANKAEALQETRVNIATIGAGRSAIYVIEHIAQALNVTLDYDIEDVPNLNGLICTSGTAVDYAANIINDICNYYGYCCQVVTPSRLRVIGVNSQAQTLEGNYIALQEIRAETRYIGGVCVNKISPNAEKQTYSYAIKKGKDAAQLIDPDVKVLQGEYQQNDGLSAEDYKTYKDAYTLEYTVDPNAIMGFSEGTGLLHNTPTAEARKALFFCAPCTDLIMIEQHLVQSEILSSYVDPATQQQIQYYPTYKDYQQFYGIFCAPSWVAGRDMYAYGNINQPGGDLTNYRIFTDQADTQITLASSAMVLEYLPGAELLRGWDASTLNPNDPNYSSQQTHYPNVIPYPDNKIEYFNMPANDEWPYWPWRRYIEDKDDSGEISGRIDYDPPGGTKSIVSSWNYVKSIDFSVSKYDAGFSNINGIPAAEVSSESFFDPRKNAMQYKDSFYIGGASNLHGTPGIASMGQLPNIKYTLKQDPSYMLIYLQPNKIKAAVSARWNYDGVKPPVFAAGSAAINISDIIGSADMRAAEITAVYGGNGEATAADVSYTIGTPSEQTLTVTSHFWGTRSACEAAIPAFSRIFGDNADYISFSAPMSDSLDIGGTMEIAGDMYILTELSYNIDDRTISGKLLPL